MHDIHHFMTIKLSCEMLLRAAIFQTESSVHFHRLLREGQTPMQ